MRKPKPAFNVSSYTQQVYDAEGCVRRLLDEATASGNRTIKIHGSMMELEQELLFGSVAQIRDYVNALAPGVGVETHDSEGPHKNWAWFSHNTGKIYVPYSPIKRTFGSRELVILHEIAHSMCHYIEDHGLNFQKTLVTLVEKQIGPVVGFVLRTAYADIV